MLGFAQAVKHSVGMSAALVTTEKQFQGEGVLFVPLFQRYQSMAIGSVFLNLN